MKKAKVVNPCFLIDEVDKFSSDYRGDPAYALLEALDPNQNKKFIDNYLGEEVPYNLSEVMFICTANDERELPLPLLDRMEVVRLSSYTEIEKFHIAKEYLIPESLKKHNLNSGEVVFSYVQSYLEENKENFKKELALLEKRDVNVHAPEGAVEKEGPSAGIALTTAILSALTNQKIPVDIGMTGEITSKGKVLEIG